MSTREPNRSSPQKYCIIDRMKKVEKVSSSKQCISLTKKGARCKNFVKYPGGTVLCHIHQKNHNIPLLKYKKPDECPVCYYSMNKEKNPLTCGHWVHLKCVKRHFKPECPICRHPLKIKVTGQKPEEIDDIPVMMEGYSNG